MNVADCYGFKSGTLIKRRVDITHRSVGPKQDPYDRETLCVSQAFADGTRLDVEWISCSLEDSVRFVVNDEIVSDFDAMRNPETMAEAVETFTDLVGVPPYETQRAHERWWTRQDKWRTPCMVCGSEWCLGRCVE